jgi:hypothetical protein
VLAEKFEALQKQMQARFEEIRVSHQHRTTIGTNVEAIVKEFLRAYLPNYHRIGQGEVIDTHGRISPQMDIVITNEFHPFLSDQRWLRLFEQ